MKQKSVLFSVIFLVLALEGLGQLGVDYDIKKPKKYETRKLGYEKTTETKFKLPRHFIQNTVTHYNYYFNANVKLNEILARAKNMHLDDYSQLLSFYSYSLEATAGSARDLDSVIYKCTTGILIHDLRNDWVDNLYMLMGKAYYYKRNFDTAYFTFQFLNSAFAPKEEDGYPKYIASNDNREEGGNAFIVSTNEKRNIFKRTFSMPPNRNESLVWQIRTFIASNQLDKAAALINILLMDPQFPPRLYPELEEVQALLFYTRKLYDSAAIHLEKALPNAGSKPELARWEYLIGQLYDRAGKPGLSKTFFEKASEDTYNPVLDVYARMNAILQNKGTGMDNEDFIQKNIEALNKLARREIYADYRDIIYYTAAQMELQRNAVPAAISDLVKSVKSSLPNSPIRNKSFLELGDLAFSSGKYKQAKQFYDSVNTQDPAVIGDPDLFAHRKKALGMIVSQLTIIERQDSLLQIAAMPPDERTAYVKKIVRRLRKEQGLVEEEQEASRNLSSGNASKSPTDLFSSDATGEWYFNNPSLKAKGFTDFKSRWGNRPNADNWFLLSAVSKQGAVANANNAGQVSGAETETASQISETSITFDHLMANLPLTPDRRQRAMDSVENAFFALGLDFQQEIPDYQRAIDGYDSLLVRFPDTRLQEEALYNLYVCYKMLGDENSAARIQDLLKQKFPAGKSLQKITDPDAINKSENSFRMAATRGYENVYTEFIEGNFNQALADKKISDSLYGSKYWTPQLLYIESIYFIHERRDAEAATELNNIVKKFPNTGMAAKAKNLLSVLSRRKQIEDYLTNLELVRSPEDTLSRATAQTSPGLMARDSSRAVDSGMVSAKLAKLSLPDQKGKEDRVKAADRKIRTTPAPVPIIPVDPAKLAMLQKREDSIQLAMQKAKNDAAKLAYLTFQRDSVQKALAQMKADSATAAAARISAFSTPFTYKPAQAHLVAIVMNKVDPVYVSEARNAFIRYNRETYYNKPLQIDNAALDDSIRLVLIQGFDNSADAMDYLEKARKLAAAEILPWLPAGKYSFIVISGENLVTLRGNKDLENYKKFLGVYYPGKF